MITLILQALFFMLPAYAANSAPVIFQWIPWGTGPIDHGKTWNGQRIFGDHKTYRGIVLGILTGIAVVWLQTLRPPPSTLALLPYASFSIREILLFGSLLGGGALLGDLLKSFFKRRIGVGAGRPWIPFDQLDFVIGALVALAPVFIPPLSVVITIIIVTPLLHLLSNIAAYHWGLKKVWW